VEAGINLLGPILLDVLGERALDRDGAFPTGNRLEHPDAAPHGVYPSSGRTAGSPSPSFDDAEVARPGLGDGRSGLGAEARFANQAARFANQDALDALIGAWTRTRIARADARLQAAGVPAGAVQTAEDTNDHDPQIAGRACSSRWTIR
jgi:crotonobetainyl-CoA:carnitine CoA-transferase CaiB-like acyl-CoA transferase